jgi:spore coat polysaccharide biosynthesis protein SpsF (cytidylyltransferase family)
MFVRRNTECFRVAIAPAPAPLRRPDLRVTVDTAADLEHVRQLYARVGVEMPSLRRLIEAAGAREEAPPTCRRPVRTEVA